MYLGKISHDVFEMLISTLTRFFSFAVHFDPEIEDINKTTHTSPYTYWFLVLSADILIKCSLSSEARARHAYLLAVTAARLDEGKACDYLVLTAAIYASVISKSSEMYSSSFGGEFLRAVSRHRDRFTGKMSEKQSKLHKAVKANEIAWVDIDRALEALRHSDTAIVTSSAGANDTMAGRQPLSSAYDRDPTLDEGRESSRDLGESPFSRMSFDWSNSTMQKRKVAPSFMERAHLSTHPKRSIPLDLGEIWTAKVIRESWISLSIHGPLHRYHYTYFSINFDLCVVRFIAESQREGL